MAKINRILLTVLMVIVINACSVNKLFLATNVADLATKASQQYPIVEYRLKNNSHLFTKEEKEILSNVAEKVILSRDYFIRLYGSQGVEALALGTNVLAEYQALKLYYMQAIDIIESKVYLLPPAATIDIKVHIATVKQLDIAIQEMLVSDSNREEAVKQLISVVGIIAKIVVAVSA